jgi:ribonuclease R
MVHVSTMADDYYRFVERAHILRGEKNGRVYRLGDRVNVQVIRVDTERRQIDLGLTEILEAVRRSGGRPDTRGRRPDRDDRRPGRPEIADQGQRPRRGKDRKPKARFKGKGRFRRRGRR